MKALAGTRLNLTKHSAQNLHRLVYVGAKSKDRKLNGLFLARTIIAFACAYAESSEHSSYFHKQGAVGNRYFPRNVHIYCMGKEQGSRLDLKISKAKFDYRAARHFNQINL